MDNRVWKSNRDESKIKVEEMKKGLKKQRGSKKEVRERIRKWKKIWVRKREEREKKAITEKVTQK